MRRPLRWIVAAVAVLAALYATPAAALWALQDAMLFPAPGVPRATLDTEAARHGARPVTLTTADGVELYAWYTPSTGDRLILYFHGNGSTPGEAARLRPLVAPHGYGLLAPTYRGYPPSGGVPSEAGLIEDARAAWSYATEELGFAPENIVLHGRSLGGGVATALATEVAPRARVLECTFASVRDVAAGRYPIYPVSWLIRHPFDSEARAPRVRAPTLVVHGDQDEVVPVAHGRRLARAFPDAAYVEVPGEGHGGALVRGEGAARVACIGLLAR